VKRGDNVAAEAAIGTLVERMKDVWPVEGSAKERKQRVFFNIGVTRLGRLAILFGAVAVKERVGGIGYGEAVENFARINGNTRGLLIDGVSSIKGDSHASSFTFRIL
jgi:hypothetical protein